VLARRLRSTCTGILAALLASLALRAAAPDSVQTVDDRTGVLESVHADRDFELTADPRAPMWRDAPSVEIARASDGARLAGPPTEVRSRWTTRHLYLAYVCPYDTLTLKPDPDLSAETPRLWTWDVAEAFIGADVDRIGVYREFQVSPQGEWVDLAIDRDNPGDQEGARWNSGVIVKARVDADARVWYGEMRIPFAAIDARPPARGREFRLGLFRLSGTTPRVLHFWRPSHQPSFHVPRAFGILRLN